MSDADLSPSRRAFALAALALAAAAFALYFASSLLLEQRGSTKHFGADSWHYSKLSQGRVIQQLSDTPDVIRITRFHPATVALASAWMSVLKPLSEWIAPKIQLKAFFALTGSIGVLAAIWALAAVVPRRYALLGGAIYALSLSVWYFSSIEESKILTATLAAIYIAVYMRLRERWSLRGFLLLTFVLLIACLNEIVAIFLGAIPFIETFAIYRFEWRRYLWLVAHGAVGPLAILILEIAGGLLLGPEPGKEWRSHIHMFLYFMQTGDHGLLNQYLFFLNWLLFSIAAPTAYARYQLVAPYGGYFDPAFSNYFSSVWGAGIAGLLCVMALATFLPRFRGARSVSGGLLLGLACYSLARALFFFLFNPAEPFLFSAATILPHIMLVLVPFAASKLPGKEILLGVFTALLLIANALFIIQS